MCSSDLFLTDVGINMTLLSGVSVMGLSFDPIWTGVVTARTIYMPLTTMLVIVVLGVLYPALKASRITPLEAIHHQ